MNQKVDRLSDRLYEMTMGLKDEIRVKADVKEVRQIDQQLNRKVELDVAKGWIKE